MANELVDHVYKKQKERGKRKRAGAERAEEIAEKGIVITNFLWDYCNSRNCCFCSLEKKTKSHRQPVISFLLCIITGGSACGLCGCIAF